MGQGCCSAVYTLPNYEHGYCSDDNARALILMMLLEELEESFPERHRLTSIYAGFLQNAFDADRGCFRRVMSYRREWKQKSGPRTATLEPYGRWEAASGAPNMRRFAHGRRSFLKEPYRLCRISLPPRVGPCDHRIARVSAQVERRSHGHSASRGIVPASAISLPS